MVDHRHHPTAMKLSGQKNETYLKHSTVGWQLCCQSKDGSTSWENLADLKESHSIEQANMPRSWRLTMNQLSTGGYLMSQERGTALFLL
jgi:hypothetical protein